MKKEPKKGENWRKGYQEGVKEEHQRLIKEIKSIKPRCSYHGTSYSPQCKECDIEIAKEEMKEKLLKLLERKK